MPLPYDTPEAAELDAKVIRLRSQGLTFREIATELGYVAQSYVYRCYQRGKRRIVAPAVEEFRASQLAEIEAERELLEDILHAEHPLVSNGRRFDDLVDDGPVLAALDRRAKLRAQEMDLLGLKAPVRVEATVTEVTQEDIELRQLVSEYQARNAATKEALRGQA